MGLEEKNSLERRENSVSHKHVNDSLLYIDLCGLVEVAGKGTRGGISHGVWGQGGSEGTRGPNDLFYPLP